jgi:hypothetical protein
MAQEEMSPKYGAEHASAMFRQGLSELRAALYNESNIAQPPQYGLYGTKTPGEVAEDRGSSGRELDEQPSSPVEPSQAREPIDSNGPTRAEPEMERD